jgi:hypothetical protein
LAARFPSDGEITDANGNRVPTTYVQIGFGSGYIVAQAEDPAPETLPDFSHETTMALSALAIIEDFALTRSVGAMRSSAPADVILSVVFCLRRLNASLPLFVDRFRQVHHSNVPIYDGQAVESYHEAAIRVCESVYGWLHTLLSRGEVKQSDGLELFERLRNRSEMVSTKSQQIRRLWPFTDLRLLDLSQRVLWESRQAERALSQVEANDTPREAFQKSDHEARTAVPRASPATAADEVPQPRSSSRKARTRRRNDERDLQEAARILEQFVDGAKRTAKINAVQRGLHIRRQSASKLIDQLEHAAPVPDGSRN